MAHEWTLYASDGQVAARTNNVLCSYDLRQLRDDQGWMTDTLIHYGVTEYNGVHGDLLNNVLWIAPSVVKTAKDGDDGAFDNSLGAQLGLASHLDDPVNALPQGATVLLLPVNNADSHWSLLAFYKTDEGGHFVHYDSMQGYNDDEATALIDKLADKGYLSASLAYTKPAEVQPQVDGYNCGLYVMQYAREIMAQGRSLQADEITAITSGTSDTLRGDILTALEPLFPPAPVGAPIPVYGGGGSGKRRRRKAAPKKKDGKDVILKQGLFESSSGRKKKLRTAVLYATRNDKPFTDCFISTSPNAKEVIKGKRAESLMALVEEACALWESIGTSDMAQTTRKDKHGRLISKYSTYANKKTGFSFEPQFVPNDDELERSMNVINRVTPEGFQPTFFQFQRQDMNTILAHCKKSVPDHHHNHQHIARSLVLGVAMANFYVIHGQPRFLPGDTRPKEHQDTPPDDPDEVDGLTQRDLALQDMPEPADDEVDVAAIAYGIGMHDSARAGSGADLWEHESGRNAFYFLRELGYGNTYAAYIARIIVKNEDADDSTSKQSTKTKDSSKPKLVAVSKESSTKKKKGAKNTARIDVESDVEIPPNINAQIVHDADTLEIHRVLNGKKFLTERLLFLTDKKVDKLKFKGTAKEHREALIADAALFVELTTNIKTAATKDKPSGVGRLHFEDILDDYEKATGTFGGYFEAHESLLIEAIVEIPEAFPFFYKYYFHSCFDPRNEQFRDLAAPERLALVRARINTIERLPRDHELATAELKKYNKANKTKYKLDEFCNDLVQCELTVNLRPESLSAVIDSVDHKVPANLQQFWEVFWKTKKTRTGASNDEATRDTAEMHKVQYRVPRESDNFERTQRPKYAAINLAHTTAGACPKYGSTVYVLKPHVWQRVTITHNDTFSHGVWPDDLCTPNYPFTLMRKIELLRFSNDHLLLYAGGKGEDRGQVLRMQGQAGAAIPYVEVHVHGLVTWERDVEEIRIEVVNTDATAKCMKNLDLGIHPTFDAKVQAFAAQWDSKDRPNGIPVRFTHKDHLGVFATRADAINNQNALSADVIRGKLKKATKMHV